MKQFLIIIALVMLVLINTKESNFIIPDSAIRFRIVANSNSIQDQTIKNNLEKQLETYLFKIINKSNSSEEVKEKLVENKDNIRKFVNNYMDINNIKSDFNVSIGNNYFPKKVYKGVTYEAGYYDSIVVNLGRGEGINWWCVIYPPLCLIDREKNNSSNIEYTSLIKEMLNKYNV